MWQGNGDVPAANFNYISSGSTIQFNNLSLNSSSYSWDFGDGNFSGLSDPQNTYAVDGQYIVTLSSMSDCLTYTYIDTISVNSTSVFSSKNEFSFELFPNPVKTEFCIGFKNIKVENVELQIYNSYGQLTFKKNYDDVSFIRENMEGFSVGLYSIIIFSDKYRMATQKMIVEK